MPVELIAASKSYDPSRVPKYAITLAGAFHRFYSSCRVRGESKELSMARLALCVATKHAIANSLVIMNITVPEKM